MNIFQKTVLKKHLLRLDQTKIDKAYLRFQSNYNASKIEKIKELKEEEYQDGFLRDIFVDVLGYTMKPSANFNLIREFKNQTDAKKADGAILNVDKVLVVIELKSCTTKDLTSVSQQAFNYKNNQTDCKYVITSNFQKIRFYIEYANDFDEFDLFSLQRTDFERMYLIMCKESIFCDLPLTIKKETVFHEKLISEQLYKDYSNFKYKIFDNLVLNNHSIDKLTLFEKSQKLLDRLLFIFFAEDSGLLPTNSISRMIERFDKLEEEDAYKPLYDIFKQYFGYMNIGRKGKNQADDIPAYNGGLFAPDEILDSLLIDDAILKTDSLKISQYDFSSEIDVNILGHIFEHSLNEIEEIEQGFTENSDFSIVKINKRKKEGVFYTPRYITQYIVENTLGKLCQKKRKELNIYEIEFKSSDRTKKGLSENGKILYQNLNKYKEWLVDLKIVDPACGSGAFLNQALQFLMVEHKQIDDILSELTGQSLRLFDTDKVIIENNLYGVDINQESVEITQLSLWLRTARKDRKLSSLNNNIRCKNSLLDNYSLNFRKAFKWETEFPEIMKNGGFDVVLGNPPYIKETNNKMAFEGLHTHYCYQGKMDLWYFFGALALEIVKKDTGLIGYIAPNNWITNDGAQKFRNVILKNGKIIEFIDFSNFKVFDSAGIQTMIYIMKRSNENEKYEFEYAKIIESKIDHETNQLFLQKKSDARFTYFNAKIDKINNLDKPINFINQNTNLIISKIGAKQNFFFLENEIFSGIDISQDFVNKDSKSILGNSFKVGDGVFVLSQNEYETLNFTEAEKALIKPFYTTDQFKKYHGDKQNKYWIIYTNSSFKNPKSLEAYPNIKKHLDKYQTIITSENKPYGLNRARQDGISFIGEKIISKRKCQNYPVFTYVDFDAYFNRTFLQIITKRIDLKYLTSILNSKLIAFWLKYKGKMQGDNYQIDKNPLVSLPIRKGTIEIENKLVNLVDLIINHKQKDLDYSVLLTETKTQNNFDREILLKKELELVNLEIKNAIQKIDQSVYELYELSEQDILTIESEINF